jgi:hypothetical protein
MKISARLLALKLTQSLCTGTVIAGTLVEGAEVSLSIKERSSAMPTPGERVVITTNAFQYAYGDFFMLVATQGSLARSLSIEEYSDYFDHAPYNQHYDPHSPKDVKKWMEEDSRYPFQFETVASPDPAIAGDYLGIDCNVGSVVVLSGQFFQVIPK